MKVQKFLHVFPHHTYNVYRCRKSTMAGLWPWQIF